MLWVLWIAAVLVAYFWPVISGALLEVLNYSDDKGK